MKEIIASKEGVDASVFHVTRLDEEIFKLKAVSGSLLVIGMRKSVAILNLDTFSLKSFEFDCSESDYPFDFGFLQESNRLVVILAKNLLEISRDNFTFQAHSIDLNFDSEPELLIEKEFIQYAFLEQRNEIILVDKELMLMKLEFDVNQLEPEVLQKLEFTNSQGQQIDLQKLNLHHCMSVFESERIFSIGIFFEEKIKFGETEILEIGLKIFKFNGSGKNSEKFKFNKFRNQSI